MTKEQRTRLASQETRSDANKAMYYEIQAAILEKEKDQTLDKVDQKLLDEAQQIINMNDKINNLSRAAVSIDDKEMA